MEGRLHNVCKDRKNWYLGRRRETKFWDSFGVKCVSCLKWKRPEDEHVGRGEDVEILDLYIIPNRGRVYFKFLD